MHTAVIQLSWAGYLLFLPPPVVVRQGGWCYQAGDGGYRLGYMSGDFTYFEAKFRTQVYGQVGEPPAGEVWQCDAMVERLQRGDVSY